ncbi:probable G-protein coupled receptor 25 [Pygocentrus nattereri]|uniref:G-protein coupled receptors family 1 profile domain-containing protein n=1 Tax=Pygocentrus nattereri TaxID=42514 RepID=A0A3B4E1I4_PYGNA|nr:probable G-protein coupled receptor 25 [Pygocentrus nattereri]
MDNTTEQAINYEYYYDLAVTDTPGSASFQVLYMSHIYIPMLYFMMFFAGFSGNLFVLIVIGNRHKRSRRLVDTFVLNLALADLVFVFTLPLWAVSAGQFDHWPFGNVLCKISSYIITVNRFSNIFFLTCMSVDRYLAVVRLMDSHFLRSSKCVHLTCGVVWGISLLFGIPSLVYRNLYEQDDKGFCLDNLESFFFRAMILLTVFLTFMLPVLIIVLCYGSILVKLRSHSITAANPRTEARRRHSLKIVFTIITTFLVSWLPYNVFKTIQVISKMSDAELSHDTHIYLARGLIISSCLAFVNSCVNPAIYLFLDKQFRRSAAAMCLNCLRHGDTQQSYFSSNSISNGTTESLGSTTSRARLFSLTQKN